MTSIDINEFENNHSELLCVDLADIETKLKSMQNDIDIKINTKRAEKNKKENEGRSKIMKFKNPTEEINNNE